MARVCLSQPELRTHDLSVVGVLGLDVLREVAPAGAKCLLPNERAATAIVADDGLVLVVQDRIEVEEAELLVAEHRKMKNKKCLTSKSGSDTSLEC
ncbi:hypothetical protein PC116_g17895 [Phytophthora cactorum]|nr:hypothetical protein PC116_g17895 [Phytophthora cactorum]